MRLQALKAKRRLRRKTRIRGKVFGTPERYRMTVYRSLTNISVQIVDDLEGKTLVSASSLDKDVRDALKPDMKKVEVSKVVGSALAKKAIEKNIKCVAFDRNGYIYHGRIKALADAAREAGLEF